MDAVAYACLSSPHHPGQAQATLRFRFGLVGALGPFALFLAGVAWLGLHGAPDEKGFWPVLLAAIALGLALAEDRGRYSEALIEGMSRPIVMLMVSAWLLAGVLGTLLSRSGFVEALIWAANSIGLEGGGYVAAAFLVCCLVSTSTGTSFGTILVAGPLLYPAGAAVGASPGFLLGAIIAGATFGDNVSPISDTTIASAGTQGADIRGVVRSRMRYALPAAAVSLVAFVMLGGAKTLSAGAAVPTASVEGWPMIAVPALVIVLLLRRSHLIEGLIAGISSAVVLGLALGRFGFHDVFHIDAEAFGARGLIIEGLERGVGISVFTILLVGLLGPLEAAGVIDRLVTFARRTTSSRRGAEGWIFGTTSAAVLLTTHSVVALLAVAPLARELGARFDIGRYRRANLLDVTVCTYPFLLPYCVPTILAASVSAHGVAAGMPRLSPFQAGVHNIYSLALLVVIGAAVLTGWGSQGEE